MGLRCSRTPILRGVAPVSKSRTGDATLLETERTLSASTACTRRRWKAQFVELPQNLRHVLASNRSTHVKIRVENHQHNASDRSRAACAARVYNFTLTNNRSIAPTNRTHSDYRIGKGKRSVEMYQHNHRAVCGVAANRRGKRRVRLRALNAILYFACTNYSQVERR